MRTRILGLAVATMLTLSVTAGPDTATASAAPQLEPIAHTWTQTDITDDGLVVLRTCETENDYTVKNGLGLFHGAYQYLQATWDAAAAQAGFPQYVGVNPADTPPAVQDAVTRYWWTAADPTTHWPNCSDDVYRAMGMAWGCRGRNVVRCVRPEQSIETNPTSDVFEALSGAPIIHTG